MQRAEAQRQTAAMQAERQAALNVCELDHGGGAQANVVSYARCANAADGHIRPLSAAPDLFDLQRAYRVTIAERRQSGAISASQADLLYRQIVVEITKEEERRRNSRGRAPQQSSADAAQFYASLNAIATNSLTIGR